MAANRIEVQGIVAAETGEPLVQFRLGTENGIMGWQATVADAREHAQQVVEAAMNAVYDASIVEFCKEQWPEQSDSMAAGLLTMIRRHRADAWGLPDQPDDWRPKT